MDRLGSLLTILERLDGQALAPPVFAARCVEAGWSRPTDDGVGLWESFDPSDGTRLTLDTNLQPPAILYVLDGDDDYQPQALLEASLRHRFDLSFLAAAEALGARFPRLTEGTYNPPYRWRFAHFQGLNAVIAVEQSDYDPQFGVLLLVIWQPAGVGRPGRAISEGW
jgi:hypothetical protein